MRLLQKLRFRKRTCAFGCRKKFVMSELSHGNQNDRAEHEHQQDGCARQKFDLASPISESGGHRRGHHHDEWIMGESMSDNHPFLTIHRTDLLNRATIGLRKYIHEQPGTGGAGGTHDETRWVY